MRDTCGVSLTRVQVVAVDVGAAVAAADAAEGGDGVSVAVAVAEIGKRRKCASGTEGGCASFHSHIFFLPVRVSVAYRVVSRVLLLVSRDVKTHFLPVALALLPLALSRYVALRGARLC